MLDNFDFVKVDISKSVAKLDERQSFGFVFVGSYAADVDTAATMPGPPPAAEAGGIRLVRAVPTVPAEMKEGPKIHLVLKGASEAEKKVELGELAKVRVDGQNDDLLVPFQKAFEVAFAADPDTIYFLTDGRFGEGLGRVVAGLNKEKKVQIHTVAFITEEPGYKEQLKRLAEENGGKYRFIPESVLGK